MDTSTGASAGSESPLTEGELRIVQQAILMVSCYGTPRVVIAGLRYGDLILEPAERLAAEAGVQVVPLETATPGRLDLAVEPRTR
jgi:hypothetical protein